LYTEKELVWESLTCSPKIWSKEKERNLVKQERKGQVTQMKKSRYTEEQIAFALQQAEHGTSVAEVCRKIGVPE
jgi:putative transposase